MRINIWPHNLNKRNKILHIINIHAEINYATLTQIRRNKKNIFTKCGVLAKLQFQAE